MRQLRSCALLALILVASLLGRAQSFSAADAKGHIGEKATVCGTVASERTASSSRGQPTFINLDAAYPHQVFTILIWGEDRPKVGTLPRQGSRACATGLIQDYRGVPEIVVRTAAQLGGKVSSTTSAAPSGATALCRDGSYSFSRHRQGTCSHHGGVGQWLQ
jgi:hypothetical protein